MLSLKYSRVKLLSVFSPNALSMAILPSPIFGALINSDSGVLLKYFKVGIFKSFLAIDKELFMIVFSFRFKLLVRDVQSSFNLYLGV